MFDKRGSLPGTCALVFIVFGKEVREDLLCAARTPTRHQPHAAMIRMVRSQIFSGYKASASIAVRLKFCHLGFGSKRTLHLSCQAFSLEVYVHFARLN